MIVTIAGAFALTAWLYLLIARGGFWREFARRPVAAPAGAAPAIVAVIPARNEAPYVVRAIASLAAQQYAGRFHIILVDDDSSDGTADAARGAAPASVLTVVRARPLPAGWTGKLWAIAEGVRQAPFEADFFLFTDADITHPPDNLKTLAARGAEGYDLVSLMATLTYSTAAEQALIPAFVFFFFLLYPPEWIRDPRHSTAGAAGGCILIRRMTLERIGGIEAIRTALIDDCALAAAVKGDGGRVWLGLGAETRSIRPYSTFSEIGQMIARTAFTQLRYSALLLVGTVLGLVLTFLVPPALAIFAPQPAAAIGAGAWLLMAIAYLPVLRFYRTAWFWAPLLPAVAVFYLGYTVRSAVSYWRGRGGQWKGRAQA